MIEAGPGWESIPGETPIDPSELKIRSVRTRAELDIVESAECSQGDDEVSSGRFNNRVAPFDFGWVFRLHEEMFGDVWKWAGQQRKTSLNLGCAPSQMVERLGSLLGDLRCWSTYGTPMHEQAAMLHHLAVAIHPFENGNGRWSRLMANIWLHLNQAPLIDWPNQTIGKKDSAID